jgi:hypothetical protein
MVEEYYDSTFGIFLGVNNGAMTYILINSVKQLNQQNIELLNKIEVLQNQLKEIIKSESIPIKDIVAEYPTIGQNKPNLFDSKTTISYFIPQYIKEAYIRVFDSNNLTLKIYKIENSGNGEVVFECNSCFDKTILYYSLIINEKIIDIKKMVQN